MILILNTITNEEYRQRFHSCIRDQIYPKLKVRDLGIGSETGDLKAYSHLIISGSGLSTVEGSKHEEQFMDILSHFVSRDKAVLGICYGHQLLAKYLGGRQRVGKSKQPQFGFRRITIGNNALFKDMSDTFSMVAHFDEVTGLEDDYEITARDNEGVIQGFQYKGTRIWGVQFHPEYDYFGGLASWERKIRNNPEWIKYFQNEVPSYRSTNDNGKVFSNFIKL
jgi:GMP synthase-like glutamine amidotransferase